MGVAEFSNQALVEIENAVAEIKNATDQISGIVEATNPMSTVNSPLYQVSVSSFTEVLSIVGDGVLKWFSIQANSTSVYSHYRIYADGVLIAVDSDNDTLPRYVMPTGKLMGAPSDFVECNFKFQESLIVQLAAISGGTASAYCGYEV